MKRNEARKAPLVDGRGTDVRVSQYILSSSWQLVNILLIGYRFRIRGVSNGGGEVEIQFAEQKIGGARRFTR